MEWTTGLTLIPHMKFAVHVHVHVHVHYTLYMSRAYDKRGGGGRACNFHRFLHGRINPSNRNLFYMYTCMYTKRSKGNALNQSSQVRKQYLDDIQTHTSRVLYIPSFRSSITEEVIKWIQKL